MPNSLPAEIHIFDEQTYGKWMVVLRYRIPYREGFSDFLGPSHYRFVDLMNDLVWMFGAPQDWQSRLKIKHPVRWYIGEGKT